MPAAQPEMVIHCRELLSPLGAVRVRRMFGGHGFYVDELFIALIAQDRFYLKVDAATRPAFEAAACTPFVYNGAGKSVTLGYFTAPEEAMESPPLMQPWARLALAAALRARAAKPLAVTAATQAKPRKGAASNTPAKR